uniref:Tudor domain-containing protein n=1 Tax=Nicotiana tabacum TaxID=4097 RepID=A0A1S4D8J1_TOBAC|nr:PREDICTED: uncharacterized protein LOC107827136 [Nicotiana tabacum]
MPGTTCDLLRCWNNVGGWGRKKRWWRAIPACIWWNVWKERNDRCFEDRRSSLQKIKFNSKAQGQFTPRNRLSFEGVDPKKFIGLQCKVYWPLDADWYSGRVIGYNSETGQHYVKYVDGDEEHLLLSNERVKFSVSLEEMSRLKLICCLNCRNILMTQRTISIFSWAIIEISSSSMSTWCYLTYLRRAIQNQRRRFV